MKTIIRLLTLTTILIGISAVAGAQTHDSVYTPLHAKACRTVSATPAEGGSYVGICRGVGGYKLQLEEGDLRQNIQVITPTGKKHSLELWDVIGTGFSSLGEKAEWRIKRNRAKVTPIALIVRYDVANPEDSSKHTSWLAVAKITDDKVCVTDKIAPKANANLAARAAADSATGKPCLKSSN
jgi:hypothetical protein